MGKEVTKMYALFPRKKRMGWRKALRGLMQSFAWTLAKLCVDTCKALRWHMQCFASEMGKKRHRNRLPYSG